MSEQLWTGFNGQKLAAERAKRDWNGRLLTDIESANDSTITIKVADASTGPTAGTFTTNQASAGTVTIPAAVSAPSGGSATPGVMSATDKEKLDGISDGATCVEESQTNGNIVIDGHETDVYTHPDAGPASVTSVGDTTNQTPGFGDTFKVTSETVDTAGHTTAVAEHTVTIPDATATASTSGQGGSAGLMSATDKEKLDGLPSAVNDGTLSITVGSAQAQTFTANQAGNTTVTIPNAASASGGSAATGGLMTDTDKANLDNATEVIPSTATAQNKLVDQASLEAAIADFGGYKKANGTGADMHPDVANPDVHFIYLVKDTSATGADVYKEWICTNTTGPVWELVGDTTMDMSGYVEMPSTHTDTHIVVFGPNDDIVDSGKTVAELENAVTTISVGSGTAISPTSGTTNINIPNATTSADGAMSSADKAKLDGITDYLVSASVSNSTLTITPSTGSAVTLTVPVAAASTDTPEMDGTADVGVSDAYARADHVHPSDTAKADKVVPAAAGNLAALDTNGNLADSGVAPGDFVTGVKLEGASNPLTPTSGVVTIPNAISTGTSGASNGLMTANQSLMLDQIGAWTWSSAPFDDSGMGTETTVNFPFTVS